MPITITLEGKPLFDQRTQSFLPKLKAKQVRLEHSLISVSRWEEQTKRKFFSKTECPTSKPDILFYIQCMSLDGPIDDKLLLCISEQELRRVINYIGDNRTATTFRASNDKGSNEVLTSETIYYYMAAFRLPWYAEKWHISRLLTLIRVANDKQSQGGKRGRGMKPNKVNYNDKFNNYSQINAKNRALLHSKG